MIDLRKMLQHLHVLELRRYERWKQGDVKLSAEEAEVVEMEESIILCYRMVLDIILKRTENRIFEGGCNE